MTILFDPRTSIHHNPAFGAGILPARRRRGPTPAPAPRPLPPPAPAAIPAPGFGKWASDREAREHFLATTLSPAEFSALRADRRRADLARTARAESAECAELGIDPARLEELADEAALIDRMMGWDFTPEPEAEVRRIDIKDMPYTVESIPPQGADVIAQCRVTKIGGCGSHYDLARHADGSLSCDCPAFTFDCDGTGRACKHLAAALPLGMLGEAPAPRPAPARLRDEFDAI